MIVRSYYTKSCAVYLTMWLSVSLGLLRVLPAFLPSPIVIRLYHSISYPPRHLRIRAEAFTLCRSRSPTSLQFQEHLPGGHVSSTTMHPEAATHTRKHTDTRTHTHACTHTRTHTHTQKNTHTQ